MSGSTRPFTNRARFGFTLIELLVVIGIILLLVALTITVGRGVLRQSEVRETENTLRLLEVAVQEWEIAMDRQVLYGIDLEPCVDVVERYELQELRSAGFTWANEAAAFADARLTTDRLWAILSRSGAVRDVIARVNPDFLSEAEVVMDVNDALYNNGAPQDTFRFTDSWDREILAVLPGRTFNAQCSDATTYIIRDDDGTIRTPFENRFGAAADRRIFFVSAGPSGVFGDLQLSEASGSGSIDEDTLRDADDNIYSSPVHIDSARPTQ